MKKLMLRLIFPAMLGLNVNSFGSLWGGGTHASGSLFDSHSNVFGRGSTNSNRHSRAPGWDRVTSDGGFSNKLDLSIISSYSQGEKDRKLIEYCKSSCWVLNRNYNIKLLVENGANVNYRIGPNAVAPLNCACAQGNFEIVQFLIERGADVDFFGSNGQGEMGTPLKFACECRNFEMVKALVNAGASVNPGIGPNAVAPLNCACVQGNVKIVQFLIERGANVNFFGPNGHGEMGTPLKFAFERENLKIIKILANAGANINNAGIDFDDPGNIVKFYSLLLKNEDI